MYFVHDRIFDDEQIQTLVDLLDNSNFMPATIHNGSDTPPEGFLDRDVRDAMHSRVKFLDYPDISLSLKELADVIYPDWPENLWFKEMEFLKYEAPGGRFKPHRDDTPPEHKHNRYLTSVTLLGKSDDLEGGELKVYKEDGILSNTVPMELYDTAIFPAHHQHECTRVTKGWRNVLVCWAGIWHPQYS